MPPKTACVLTVSSRWKNPPRRPASHPNHLPPELWSPRQIAFFTFFTGYPVGLVLSSINWIRIGMTDTAVVHIIAAVILQGIWGFFLSFGNTGCNIAGLLIQAGVSLYFYVQMQQIHQRLERDGVKVQRSSWKKGLLLVPAVYGVLLLIILLLYAIFSTLQSPA